MANTWQCARCATQNEETAVSCASCGLIRGGVVVASDAATTAPAAGAPPTPQQGSWPAAPSGATPQQGSWPSAPSGATPPPAMDGAVPPPMPDPSAPGGWPGAPVAPQQPQGAGKQVAKGILANVGVRVIVIVGFLALGGVVAFFVNAGRDANGNINKAGEVPVTELKLGDCYDLQDPNASFDENAVISKTTGKPCTESHHYEVFVLGKFPDQGTYPTTSQFDDWAGSNCVSAFETYVGTPIDQSSLTFFVFFPDESSWKQGDRGMQCSLADGSNKALTKSMKGSGY